MPTDLDPFTAGSIAVAAVGLVFGLIDYAVRNVLNRSLKRKRSN